MRAWARPALAAWLALQGALVPAGAVPITPTDDAQVIEQLPALPRLSASADPVVAAREARALLEAARSEGDPRLAGRALARLARWSDQPRAPAEVVLALAEAEQYLHRFAAAITRLRALLQREPGQAQAWLMLATLHRVQGRYAESDQACQALQALRVQPYGDACTAENLALRGDNDRARAMLQALLARGGDAATRGWLLTTLAELAQRAGQPEAADATWRQALRAAPDGYTRLAYADFLLDQGQDQQAWDLLQSAPRRDGELLRLAIAARRLGRPEAPALRRELLARQAQADLRPEDSGHQRERAMLALELEGRPAAALAHARSNLALQAEPIDLWLLARCAHAAGDAAALQQAREQAMRQGLRDERLASL